MAKIAMPSVLVLKDVILEIGDNDYARHVDNVTFTPTASSITWQGLSPDASFSDAGSSNWSCSISGAQDWDSADGLCRYLFANEGLTVPCTFRPRSGEGPSFEAVLTLSAPAIGGAVNAVATFTVACGVSGRPELVEVV